MLEWKPRLIVLLLVLAAIAAPLAFVVNSLSYGWGLF